MRFGWLTLSLSPSPEEDADRIDQQIEQARFAERLGFGDVWQSAPSVTIYVKRQEARCGTAPEHCRRGKGRDAICTAKSLGGRTWRRTLLR